MWVSQLLTWDQYEATGSSQVLLQVGSRHVGLQHIWTTESCSKYILNFKLRLHNVSGFCCCFSVHRKSEKSVGMWVTFENFWRVEKRKIGTEIVLVNLEEMLTEVQTVGHWKLYRWPTGEIGHWPYAADMVWSPHYCWCKGTSFFFLLNELCEYFLCTPFPIPVFLSFSGGSNTR